MNNAKYLGEKKVDVANTPYANFTPNDWAMEYISLYSQIDGAHHKQWVLDQVARILKGTKVILRVARWENGKQEYRFNLDTPSQEYLDWVNELRGEYDEDSDTYEYDYDEGIAP